VIRIDINTCKP